MGQKLIFHNRIDAGQKLADKLLHYKKDQPLILALPRGGVPVGYEVAKALDAPLDTVVPRKIGTPFHPEFGVGAIAPGGIIIFDDASLQSLGLSRKELEPIIEGEKKEMERRISSYRSGDYIRKYSKNITSDTVIIVDDGLATGVTARAAIESVKQTLKPKKIIFAAPVCARDIANQLREMIDDVVCVSEVENLMAIGYWYQEFDQTTDEEVIGLLEKANKNKTIKNE